MAKQGILPESDTNERELIEVYLNGQSFGANVAKIRQMISFDPRQVTKVPCSHVSVMGALLWMDRTIPLIDLSVALVSQPIETDDNGTVTVLVTEFNGLINGFLVDGVNRIHRVSWDKIEPTGHLLAQYHVPI